MEPVKKVRILAVGIGGYAQDYLSVLLEEEDPGYEIVGMVDTAPQNSSVYPALRERGIPLYGSMEAFYGAGSADLAIIATPIHFHTAHILCALNHGSNALCEKPMSGVYGDARLLLEAMERTGKFVMIGFQWSCAKAILDLKADISSGLYGKPVMLKSKVLWPRSREYFTRSGGWAGRIRTPKGETVNDSVVNNATAHYLHNMLYVTGGGNDRSSSVRNVECTLLRTNAIENFDTATLKFDMDNGGKGLFVVSHSTRGTNDPEFEYRFEKGTVTKASDAGDIVGILSDGTRKHYGDPSEDPYRKIYLAIEGCRDEGFRPVCGVAAASAQVACVEFLQTNPIFQVRKERIHERIAGSEHFLYADWLDELMDRCYREEKLLGQLPELEGLVKT